MRGDVRGTFWGVRFARLLGLMLVGCGGVESSRAGIVLGELETELVVVTARHDAGPGLSEISISCPHGFTIHATMPDWQATRGHALLTFRGAERDGAWIPHWENLSLEPVSLD